MRARVARLAHQRDRVSFELVAITTARSSTCHVLSPVPDPPAPDFTLVDQNDLALSLDSFKGRAVVLEFMDPHCTDICPIASQEFVDAYRDLGKAAARVVFVAVNVDQYYAGVAEVASFPAATSSTPSVRGRRHRSSPSPLRNCCAGLLRTLRRISAVSRRKDRTDTRVLQTTMRYLHVGHAQHPFVDLAPRPLAALLILDSALEDRSCFVEGRLQEFAVIRLTVMMPDLSVCAIRS